MKSLKTYIILSVIILFSHNLFSQEIAPYINVGKVSSSLDATHEKVNSSLLNNGFDILGNYHVAGNENLMVIVFSRNDLKSVTLKVKDRGALAAALKVGLKSEGNSTTISYLNPEYLFQAYLREAYDNHKNELIKIDQDVAKALSPLGNENKGFGGGLTEKELRKYHYKIMMPYFTDPVELNTFSSFEEGIKIIEKNLKSQKGNTELVYSLKFKEQKVAVFGVGLMNSETGEKSFLPTIGVDHLAAMPYEIILQGNTATMLHGRYRIALHWPDLTMGTFMKIRSAPGDIEDTFEAICK